MPTASRTLSGPEKLGTSRPWAAAGTEGRARKTSNEKATRMTPTRTVISASRGQDREGRHSGDQSRRQEWDVEDDVEPERSPHELRQVCSHGDDLGLDP